MTEEFDPRLVRVSIEVEGVLKIYEDLDVVVSGVKYANANQNECEVRIKNLLADTRNYILTETSPYNLNKTPKKLIIEAGRKSYGVSQIFVGNITASSVGQPPDITLTIKALTGNHKKLNTTATSEPSTSSLRNISGKAAQRLGLTLDFQASDKNIKNYSYTGGTLKEVDQIGMAGDVSAFVDDETLYVKDFSRPLNGTAPLFDRHSGLIGVPQLDEHGVKVQLLLDNRIKIGGPIIIQSDINPAANGTYVIYKLGFQIANRENPFYWLAECKRLNP